MTFLVLSGSAAIVRSEIRFANRIASAPRRVVYLAAGDYLLFSSVIRPLPSHFVQRGGYILRPGFAACFTLEKPVPLHASHFRSDGGDLFLIRMPQKPSVRPTWREISTYL